MTTMMDKVTEGTNTIFHMLFDREPLNYIEGAVLYGIVGQGRINMGILEVMYNQAQDSELKALIKDALESQTEFLMEKAESYLKSNETKLPEFHMERRTLHESLNIPEDARLSDREIVLAIASMAKASQMAVLTALHQAYQPDVAQLYRRILDISFDWNYKLMTLAITNGWLPHIAKISH